jgi:hypothetical protein
MHTPRVWNNAHFHQQIENSCTCDVPLYHLENSPKLIRVIYFLLLHKLNSSTIAHHADRVAKKKWRMVLHCAFLKRFDECARKMLKFKLEPIAQSSEGELNWNFNFVFWIRGFCGEWSLDEVEFDMVDRKTEFEFSRIMENRWKFESFYASSTAIFIPLSQPIKTSEVIQLLTRHFRGYHNWTFDCPVWINNSECDMSLLNMNWTPRWGCSWS